MASLDADVSYASIRERSRNRLCRIIGGVVDDDNLIGSPGLNEGGFNGCA
jgi:hypothetical protein